MNMIMNTVLITPHIRSGALGGLQAGSGRYCLRDIVQIRNILQLDWPIYQCAISAMPGAAAAPGSYQRRPTPVRIQLSSRTSRDRSPRDVKCMHDFSLNQPRDLIDRYWSSIQWGISRAEGGGGSVGTPGIHIALRYGARHEALLSAIALASYYHFNMYSSVIHERYVTLGFRMLPFDTLQHFVS